MVPKNSVVPPLAWLPRPLRLLAVAAVAAVALAVAAPVPAGAQRGPRGNFVSGKLDDPGSFIRGEVIVALQPGAADQDVQAAFAAANVEVIRPLLLRGYYLVRVKTADGSRASEQATQAAATALRANGPFRYAKPNYIRRKFDTTPNDPMFAQQWHHQVLNMPKAWDITKGDPSVVIADLDTGIDQAHPDLVARILPGVNFTVPVGDANRNNPADGDGHGTHTAGIAAASTNNGIGVAGVCYGGSMIFPGKVLDDTGAGADAWIADGITYVADNVKTASNKVVINMSLGGYVASDQPDPNDPVEAACIYAATQRDVVICMAAGNAFDQGNPASSPARAAQLDPRLICVAACGPTKEHSFFSEARPYTTISAPGGDDPTFSDNTKEVLSTLPTSQGSYGFEQGTSMACPCATGVAALLMGVGAAPNQVKSIMTQTADSVGLTVPNDQYGFGVIDAFSAVALASLGLSVPTPSAGSYVYGTTPIQITAARQGAFTGATVTVDSDPTIVASSNGSVTTMTWDTRATDPATGAFKYPNGTHKLTIKLSTTIVPLTFVRTVRVDNPIAAITSPASSGFVTGSVNVVGTSDGLRVPTFTLEYATASAPSTFVPIVTGQTGRVQNASLGTWSLAGIPDGPVTLRLRVKNPDGFEVSTTSQVTVDQTQPSVPTNLQGTATNRQDNLTWTGSTDNFQVAGYNVYRSDQSLTGYTKLNAALLSSTTYVDPNLTNGHTYFYKVTAVDAAGNESAQTNLLSLTPNRNGTASGVVNALDGTFLSGATVTVLQNGGVVPNGTTTTDQSGQYTFVSPPGFNPGTYDIEANASGYVPQLIKGVTVDLGKDALQQNFVLQAQPTFPSGWSAFTLPYNFQGADISAILPGADIRYYDPASGTYLSPGQPGFPNPAPGIGYWVNNTGTSPKVSTPGVPLSQTTVATVPIHKGWNLIGNPFQQPIHWVLNNMVIQRSDNGQQASLSAAVNLGWALDFGWGGTDGKTLLYDQSIIPGVNNTIPAYGAFWFRSEVDGTLSLSPPANVNRSASRSSTGGAASGWVTQIEATAAGQTATAYIGIGASRRVFPTAPQMTPTVRVALADDWAVTTDTTSGNGVDVRTGRAAQTWNVVVQTPDETPVTLTWPALATIPRGWHLAITDTETGQRLSMNSSSSIALPASRAAHTLKVELTRDTMNRLMITDLRVNTTRSSTPVISYTVTADTTATISVLRSNGTTLRMLATRSAAAGANTFVWDGRDNSGHPVSAGVYLVQVRAVGDNGDAVRAVIPFIITR